VQGTLQALKAELADAKKELADAEATPSGDAAADRKQQIEAKSAELAAAQKQRDDARAAYQAANAQLVKQEELVKRARAAGEERDRLIAQHDAERADLNQKNLHYEARKKESTALAYPEIPQASHVIAELQPDQRPMFALIAFGGVAALFVLGIMLTGGRRESRAMEAEPPAFDDEHAGAELPQLDSSAEHRGRARPVEV